jgi:DNA-binding beta-propeller fold protein YncE
MQKTPAPLRCSRRQWLGLMASVTGVAGSGCVPQNRVSQEADLVWGRSGFSDGRFQKPRAITISTDDELYIVDKMARIQVFDADGRFLRGWETPEYAQGKPVGLGWSKDNCLMVGDTHYYRVLFYTPQGQLIEQRTIGGQLGDGPGQFQFVTDVVQADNGHYWVGQYGQLDRIQEFDSDGNFLRMFGSQGDQPGQFSRPQGLALDSQDNLLWVADACNHRIQVFDVTVDEPKLVDYWGLAGSEPGQLRTPYGLVFDQDGTLLVCEYGNHRIQRFSREGKSLEIWGGYGKEPGQLLHPWGVAVDSKRRLHVLDSENNRIQRFQI